jgi:hypothetical protein
VASLQTGGSSPAPHSEQYLGAEALYACLTDAGLPARLEPVEDDRALVNWGEGHEVLFVFANGFGGAHPGSSGEINPDVESAFWNDHSSNAAGGEIQPALMVDGVDESATWASCLEDSGYTDPQIDQPAGDPAEELKAKQQMADATNEWIACARENGLPDLVDVSATADGWTTVPEAQIPLSMTPDALRTLLGACPNFDEEQARAMMNPDFDPEADWHYNPSVTVKLPPEMSDPGYTPDATESDALKRFEALQSVLTERANAFYEENAPDIAVPSAAAE